MNLFKKEYVLRKFSEQKIVNGLSQSSYKDQIIKLDIQPLSADELMALSEGDRAVKRIKGIGKAEIHTVDDYKGIPADRIFYKGCWYECEGSDIRDNTRIGQTSATFVVASKNENEELLKEPDMEAIRNQQENDTGGDDSNEVESDEGVSV